MESIEMRRRPKLELLFEENLDKFNSMVEKGSPPKLRDCNISGLDLRKANLRGLDLSGSYLRGSNLRGLDLTGCNLQGASLQGALISGTFFPKSIPAQEIMLSVKYGTRMRTSNLIDNTKIVATLLSEIRNILKNKN
jgi:uncharacterized protein YjbI with pentapeptide repeats